MMSKNIPAYPSGESYTTFNSASGVTSQHGKSPLHTGMTLRDHFAGLAMQTLPKNIPDMETLARMSYVMADAMIAERNKHHKERHETFGEEV
jgi:hypothetical protein